MFRLYFAVEIFNSNYCKAGCTVVYMYIHFIYLNAIAYTPNSEAKSSTCLSVEQNLASLLTSILDCGWNMYSGSTYK